MSRILVTGGAGYIGSVLVPNLLESKMNVTVLDNFMYKQTSLAHVAHSKKLEIIKGDVRDTSLVKSLVSKHDIVIPLAAIVGAPACDRDPKLANSVNKVATLELISQIGKEQRILMPTTNSAYGSGDKNNYCDENSQLRPLSRYARDKVFVEEALMKLKNASSFRLATVFGLSPRMRLDLLVNNLTYKAMNDGYVVLFEGHFLRTYVHVRDVANLFWFAIKNPDLVAGQVFNFGLSEANLSKIELCELIKGVLGNFVILEDQIQKDPDQRNYLVSNKKIERLGFRAKISVEDGVKELVKGMPMFQTFPYSNL